MKFLSRLWTALTGGAEERRQKAEALRERVALLVKEYLERRGVPAEKLRRANITHKDWNEARHWDQSVYCDCTYHHEVIDLDLPSGKAKVVEKKPSTHLYLVYSEFIEVDGFSHLLRAGKCKECGTHYYEAWINPDALK